MKVHSSTAGKGQHRLFDLGARACGGQGFSARKPEELKKAISDALAVEGPAIVDATVVADEIPNLPHLDLEMVGQFARAKIKEAVLAFTGC